MSEDEQIKEEPTDTPTEKVKKCPKSDKPKKPRTQKQIESAKKNLIPLSLRGKEEAKEIQSKGGQAFKKKCEKLKTMREFMLYALNTPQHEGEITTSDEITCNDDLKNANLTNMMQIVYGQIDLARHKNTGAAIFIRDTIGEKPTDRHEINATIEEKPNKKKILQMMQKFDENPELEKELIGDEQADRG